MSGTSKIEWTDATWNPVLGCTKVSPGCAHCYIERTPPFRMAGQKFERGAIPVVLRPGRLDWPLRWRGAKEARAEGRPSRIFVNALSDLFHESVPEEYIDRVFAVMALSPHTYQVLTKRPERMLAYMTAVRADGADTGACGHKGAWFRVDCIHHQKTCDHSGYCDESGVIPWPLPNVHLGVSAENQRMADERIPLLLQTPAAVRFVSVEPMLGPVDLHLRRCGCDRPAYMLFLGQHECPTPARTLDWVICGAESGPKRRLFDLDWARDLRDQCRAAGVPFFFKQGSASKPGQPCGDPELDGCKEFPA